jgi:primosomal protein N' (replication factor Y)
MPASFVRVAYPIPLEETFWYRNPKSARVEIGMRVEAPLGRRPKAAGYVIEVAEAPSTENKPVSALPLDLTCLAPDKIRDILRVVDTEPLFDPGTLELGKWLAAMYHCSLGEALSAMLPSAHREPKELAEEFDEVEMSRTPLVLTPGQNAALEGILAEPDGMFYLYGPTGTGKTEVFLQLAEATLAQGRGVLYLVPEIALTRQVEQDVRARFGADAP